MEIGLRLGSGKGNDVTVSQFPLMFPLPCDGPQSEQVFYFFSQPNDPHFSCCQKSHEQPEADFCQFWASGKQKVGLSCCLLRL